MTEDRAGVSVIIPCFNAAPYLAAAIDSVLAQTRVPVQIIVIDDGSDDGSADIAAGYGAALECHRQPNQGIAATRNHGLRRARAALIAFLDADDLWPADSLARRVAALDADRDLDVVYGAVDAFASPDLPPDEAAALRLPAPGTAGRLAGACLWRRSAFERVGDFSMRYGVGETLDWFARAGECGLRVGALDGTVLRRRLHGANTVRKTERLQADYLHLLRASLQRRRAAQPGDETP